MNAKLVSAYSGDKYKNISSYTFPLMKSYSEYHGIDYEFFHINTTEICRPAPWFKVKLLQDTLRLEKYDVIIWIDADVVIVKKENNILDEITNYHIQYVSRHNIDGNIHPNSGVWMITPEMYKYLKDIWSKTSLINHFWWEQAALIECMGMKMDVNNIVSLEDSNNELYKKTKFLSNVWNYCPNDLSKQSNPFFIHFAGPYDKIHDIKNAISKI